MPSDTNVPVTSTNAASLQPLPASLKRALAEALVLDHPDAPWQIPADLPHTADLRRGVAILEQQLARVDRKHAAWCLAKLSSGFNERLTESEAQLRLEVWLEVCGDIPNDLWASGVIELLRSWKRDDHFGRIPEAADLLAAIGDRFARRRLDLERSKKMLAKANQDQAPKPVIVHKPRFDLRPAAMLHRHSLISRRRVGMFGPMPSDLDAWWYQIRQAAAEEQLDAGRLEDWKSPSRQKNGA